MSETLKEKLERLEKAGVYFQAGYYGTGEVFIARFPDLTFVDFHWTDSNEKGTRQFIKPTELERIVDETVEYLDEHDVFEPEQP